MSDSLLQECIEAVEALNDEHHKAIEDAATHPVVIKMLESFEAPIRPYALGWHPDAGPHIDYLGQTIFCEDDRDYDVDEHGEDTDYMPVIEQCRKRVLEFLEVQHHIFTCLSRAKALAKKYADELNPPNEPQQ